MYLIRRYRFEAARQLKTLPAAHPCSRLHGNSFEVVVRIAGEPSAQQGWIMDFADLDGLVSPVLDQLDHRFLNEVPGLDVPTTENITRWLWDRLAPTLGGLRRIEVWESPEAGCVHEGSKEPDR